jgi:UDP-3-O-[3-hydroxymyristoyl] glucosamine N-acyltransferase
METSLTELAGIVGGAVVGDGSTRIRGVAGIDDARPGDITFIANSKYLKKGETTGRQPSFVLLILRLPQSRSLPLKIPILPMLKLCVFSIPPRARPAA